MAAYFSLKIFWFDIAITYWQIVFNNLWKSSGTKMQVSVRDNNVDQALRALKKKLQREGVFREMKLKQHFEKPSVRKAREKKEAISRQRKLARKKAEREG
jgi:small subunit ribosomal protein S21